MRLSDPPTPLRRRAGRWSASLLLGLLAPIAVAGCGGDDGGGDAGGGEGPRITPEGEAPNNYDELSTMCDTDDGFEDLPAYDASSGELHPVFLFVEAGEHWVYASFELPEGWGPNPTSATTPESLAEVEVIGCVELVSTEATGVNCEFEDEGDQIELELADGTYEIRLEEAATGAEIDTITIEASDDGECPFLVNYEEGDTEEVALLQDEEVVEALTSIVEG